MYERERGFIGSFFYHYHFSCYFDHHFLLKNIYLISFFLFPLLIIVIFSKFKYATCKNCPLQSLGTSRLAAEETEENQRVDQLLWRYQWYELSLHVRPLPLWDAFCILSIPASEVACESAFSTAGAYSSGARVCMGYRVLRGIMFVHAVDQQLRLWREEQRSMMKRTKWTDIDYQPIFFCWGCFDFPFFLRFYWLYPSNNMDLNVNSSKANWSRKSWGSN